MLELVHTCNPRYSSTVKAPPALKVPVITNNSVSGVSHAGVPTGINMTYWTLVTPGTIITKISFQRIGNFNINCIRIGTLNLFWNSYIMLHYWQTTFKIVLILSFPLSHFFKKTGLKTGIARIG